MFEFMLWYAKNLFRQYVKKRNKQRLNAQQ